MDRKFSEIFKFTISSIGLIIYLLMPIECYALEETFFEKVVKRYAELETYCDTGSYRSYLGLTGKFERCFRKDGVYKVIVYNNGYYNRREVQWSDGIINYSYIGNKPNGFLKTISYSENPVRKRKRNAELNFPDLILNLAARTSLIDTYNYDVLIDGHDYFNSNLNKYSRVNNELSNNDFTVVDYKSAIDHGQFIRTWISNKDLIITRSERYWGTELKSFVEISEYRLNTSLSKDDLTFRPPALTKYSLNRRPEVFIPVFLISFYIVGFLFWLGVFLASKRIKEDTIPWSYKHKMWKLYIIFILFVSAIFFFLYLLAIDSGHPEPVIFVVAYGYISGLVIIGIGCFLLSAHQAYGFAKMRLSKKLATAK